jgi:hypothetical protein
MIDFNQRHLEVNKKTVKNLTLMQGHLSRVRTSYWKAVGNPFLLSDAVAAKLIEVKRHLSDMQRALDAAQVEIADENTEYVQRINSQYIDKLAEEVK